MHFFGPPTNPAKDVLLRWKIKSKNNEELRGEFLDHYVPRILDLGFTLPDKDLHFDETTGHWVAGEIDWTIFWKIVKGEGPSTQARLSMRRKVWEHHRWVREALSEPLWSAA